MARKSVLPRLVFLPNHAGHDDDELARLKEFDKLCRSGTIDSWSCQKSVEVGDVYLFWFSKPASILAGIGIASGGFSQERNDGWDWTDSKIGWFCGFDPAVALKNPLGVEEIRADRVLRTWWNGRPFQGRAKRIVHRAVAGRLASLLLEKNPKNRSLRRHISRFAMQSAEQH